MVQPFLRQIFEKYKWNKIYFKAECRLSLGKYIYLPVALGRCLSRVIAKCNENILVLLDLKAEILLPCYLTSTCMTLSKRLQDHDTMSPSSYRSFCEHIRISSLRKVLKVVCPHLEELNKKKCDGSFEILCSFRDKIPSQSFDRG